MLFNFILKVIHKYMYYIYKPTIYICIPSTALYPLSITKQFVWKANFHCPHSMLSGKHLDVRQTTDWWGRNSEIRKCDQFVNLYDGQIFLWTNICDGQFVWYFVIFHMRWIYMTWYYSALNTFICPLTTKGWSKS